MLQQYIYEVKGITLKKSIKITNIDIKLWLVFMYDRLNKINTPNNVQERNKSDGLSEKLSYELIGYTILI